MKTFEELKEEYQSGNAFSATLEMIRFDLGTHKRTRLRKAGAEGSGSLLHDDVSKKHAALLEAELVAKASKMKLWSRGATELEMVNLTILEKIRGLRDDEARKLNVLNSIGESDDFMGLIIPGSKDVTRVLVHCHVVVDFGNEPEKTKAEVQKQIDRNGYWQKPYQTEVKSLFKKKRVPDSLKDIAAYVAKGGNEALRYNAGFGRDLASDLEAKIWREGMGKKEFGGETIEDERGLTLGEVKRLDELYVWLMNRRKDKRGYLIGTSGL